MNQQVEALRSLRCVSKTAICTVTRSCPHPSRFHLGVDTIELPCKSQFSTCSEGTEWPPLADCNVQIEELELSVRNASLEPANLLLYHIWKLVPPDVTHVISFTRLPLFSRATLKRSGSLGTRLYLRCTAENTNMQNCPAYEITPVYLTMYVHTSS